MLQLQELIVCTSFPKWLAVAPEHYQSEPSAVLVSLFRLVLSFVWSHELGHHICGHVQLNVGTQHFRFEATTCSEFGSLRRQAEELDADKHAVETLLNQLKRDPDAFFEGSMRGLAAASPSRDLQLRCLLAAVTVFLLSSQQCRYSAATISTLTHPPRLIRIDYLAGVIRDWLKEESLVSVLSRDDFYALVDCIEKPTTDNTGAFNAEHQARALSDDEWRKYLSDLEEVRKGLRKDNEQFEWKRR